MSYDPCICKHHRVSHVFDSGTTDRIKSICSVEGCPCVEFHPWEVVFISDGGQEFRVNNVERFVRKDHPELFDARDTEIKTCPGGSAWTNADRGLQKLAERVHDSWKGWTVKQYPKTFRH